VALAGAAGPRPAAGPHRAARRRAAARAHPRTAGPAPPTAVPVVGLPGKLRTARQGLGLRGSAAAHLPSQARVAKAGTRGARLTARRADTTGQPENAAARLSIRVTKHDEPEDQGQAARAVAPGPPGGAARMATPGGGVRRATGRGSPRPTATSVAAPGPAAARGGPPRATPAAGAQPPAGTAAQPPAGTADLRPAVGSAGGANRERRVPRAVVTGAQVPQGRAHTGPAMTMTATGARPQSVASARAPAIRRAGRPADRAARPAGRRVTGRQDPHATAAATGLRGRTAREAESAPGTAIVPATATAAGTATGPGVASAARTATGPGVASAARTATGPGVASAAGTATGPGVASAAGTATGAGAAAETTRAAGAAGPGGTRRRPGRPTSPGRRYRSRSAPSSSTGRPGPSYTACRTT
jgi:hypothetical protein